MLNRSIVKGAAISMLLVYFLREVDGHYRAAAA